MALVFTKQPPADTYAGNHHYFQFTSDEAFTAESCDLVIEYVAGGSIVTLNIFPDVNGVFTFDTFGVISTILGNGTDDSLDYSVALTLASALFADIRFTFSVRFSDSATIDTDSVDINFVRGFAETGEPLLLQGNADPETGKLLKESLQIWEGYPFDFSYLDASEDVQRSVLSDGQTLAGDLEGFELVQPSQPGLYLKWFNGKGGYSYQLFKCVFTNRIRSASTAQYRPDFATGNEMIDLNRQNSYQSRANAFVSIRQQRFIDSLFISDEVYYFNADKDTLVTDSEDHFIRVIGANANFQQVIKNDHIELIVTIETPSPISIARVINAQ